MRPAMFLASLFFFQLVTPLVFGADTDRLEPLIPNPREAEHYRIVDLAIPLTVTIEAGSFVVLPDRRLAVGTRRGDIYFVRGAFDDPPAPDYHLFASGLHEVFGLDWRDGWLYATQQGELTRIRDLDGDGRADRFETVSDAWGFGGEHEFTFGSKFDREGAIWTAHCLTGSYTSQNRFRGWAFRVSRDGISTPVCSGIRSPGGVGMNRAGDMFYTENQGPWNGACALKHLRPGGFMGHPIANTWYKLAPDMGPRPDDPIGGQGGRLREALKRIPQLVPPAVIFPYRKMGQSASGIMLDDSNGKFGPFAGQMFVGDYTLSMVMRVFLENVNGVYQGACFPFRQGFKTGIIGALLTRDGQMFVGGSKRGWPVRGMEPYALERLEWTGRTPFEVLEMRLRHDGFELEFTKPVDPASATRTGSYSMSTYTHIFRQGYGSPEVDLTTAVVRQATVSRDGRTVRLRVQGLQPVHIHELHLPGVRSESGEPLLHDVAYYTLNELVEESSRNH